MKKVFLGFALIFCVATLPCCINAETSKDKDKDKKELSTDDVPAAVKSAFSAKYSTATDVKWEDAHENDKPSYKAKFKLNDKKMKAEFDSTGAFIKESDKD